MQDALVVFFFLELSAAAPLDGTASANNDAAGMLEKRALAK